MVRYFLREGIGRSLENVAPSIFSSAVRYADVKNNDGALIIPVEELYEYASSCYKEARGLIKPIPEGSTALEIAEAILSNRASLERSNSPLFADLGSI